MFSVCIILSLIVYSQATNIHLPIHLPQNENTTIILTTPPTTNSLYPFNVIEITIFGLVILASVIVFIVCVCRMERMRLRRNNDIGF